MTEVKLRKQRNIFLSAAAAFLLFGTVLVCLMGTPPKLFGRIVPPQSYPVSKNRPQTVINWQYGCTAFGRFPSISDDELLYRSAAVVTGVVESVESAVVYNIAEIGWRFTFVRFRIEESLCGELQPGSQIEILYRGTAGEDPNPAANIRNDAAFYPGEGERLLFVLKDMSLYSHYGTAANAIEVTAAGSRKLPVYEPADVSVGVRTVAADGTLGLRVMPDDSTPLSALPFFEYKTVDDLRAAMPDLRKSAEAYAAAYPLPEPYEADPEAIDRIVQEYQVGSVNEKAYLQKIENAFLGVVGEPSYHLYYRSQNGDDSWCTVIPVLVERSLYGSLKPGQIVHLYLYGGDPSDPYAAFSDHISAFLYPAKRGDRVLLTTRDFRDDLQKHEGSAFAEYLWVKSNYILQNDPYPLHLPCNLTNCLMQYADHDGTLHYYYDLSAHGYAESNIPLSQYGTVDELAAALPRLIEESGGSSSQNDASSAMSSAPPSD